MGKLSKLASNAPEAVEKETDSLGGFQVYESDVYDVTLRDPYLMESAGGALGLVCKFEGDDINLKHTFYVTNRNGDTYYINKKTGGSHYLQGYNQANALSMFGCKGKTIDELVDEPKVLNVYDSEAGKEIPTEVDYVSELDGINVKLCIIKQTVNKNKKVESNGKVSYVPTEETKEENDIDKILSYKSGKTVNEIQNKEEATYLDLWLGKWKGKTKDRTKKITGGNGVAGKPGGNKKKVDLFADE